MVHPRKPEVEFRKEPVRFLCNEAYFLVRSFFPDRRHDGMIALGCGLVAGYFLADAGAGLYGQATVLPNMRDQTPERATQLEGIVQGSIIVEGISLLIAPQRVHEVWEEHKVYSRGVLGVMVGATLRGVQQLL